MEIFSDFCDVENLISPSSMETYINEIVIEDNANKSTHTVAAVLPKISSNVCWSVSESVDDQHYINTEKAASSRHLHTSTHCAACHDHDYDGLRTTNWKNEESTSSIDFSLCLICQSVRLNAEQLTCPALSLKKDNIVGYSSFARDMEGFNNIGRCPLPYSLELLGGSCESIVQTLADNKGKWHKTCRDAYNNSKLDRVLKRFSSETMTSKSLEPVRKATRSSLDTSHNMKDSRCFFCEQAGTTTDLCLASTFSVDSRVHSIALKLQDTRLLAKLSLGDMMAIEAKYHKRCLTDYYNRDRSTSAAVVDQNCEHQMLESIAFAELVAFVKDQANSRSAAVFKLADLIQVYEQQLKTLGVFKLLEFSMLRERIQLDSNYVCWLIVKVLKLLQRVNECRKQLFTKKDRSLDSIPPTADALKQHVKRVTYQAAFVWKNCLHKETHLPDPRLWGWSYQNDSFTPAWTTLLPATDCCKELIRCGCKKGCKSQCSCTRNGLQCTSLCACDGDCSQVN